MEQRNSGMWVQIRHLLIDQSPTAFWSQVLNLIGSWKYSGSLWNMEDPGNEEQHGNDSATTKAGTFRYLRINTWTASRCFYCTSWHASPPPSTCFCRVGLGVLFHKELQQSNEKLFRIHFYPTVHYTDCLCWKCFKKQIAWPRSLLLVPVRDKITPEFHVYKMY